MPPGVGTAPAGKSLCFWRLPRQLHTTLYAAKDYKRAEERYEAVVANEKALQTTASLMTAYFFLGNSYDNMYKPGKQGDPQNDAYLQKAIENYSRSAERNPDQDALHVVSVQGQRADTEQDKLDNEPAAHGFIRPEDIEDRSAGHVSHEIKDLAPSDRKTTTWRPRHVGALHRADSAGVTGHVGWLKRLWDHLTRRRQLSIAFLHFRGGRR